MKLLTAFSPLQLPVRGQVRERLLRAPGRPRHHRGLGPGGAGGPQDQRRHAQLPHLPLPAQGGQDGQVINLINLGESVN